MAPLGPVLEIVGKLRSTKSACCLDRKTHGAEGQFVTVQRIRSSRPHLIRQGDEHKVPRTLNTPLPAKFLRFVSSWDLRHATFGHLRRKLSYMCLLHIKRGRYTESLVFPQLPFPTVQCVGRRWGLIFNKEGISKGSHQSYPRWRVSI